MKASTTRTNSAKKCSGLSTEAEDCGPPRFVSGRWFGVVREWGKRTMAAWRVTAPESARRLCLAAGSHYAGPFAHEKRFKWLRFPRAALSPSPQRRIHRRLGGPSPARQGLPRPRLRARCQQRRAHRLPEGHARLRVRAADPAFRGSRRSRLVRRHLRRLPRRRPCRPCQRLQRPRIRPHGLRPPDRERQQGAHRQPCRRHVEHRRRHLRGRHERIPCVVRCSTRTATRTSTTRNARRTAKAIRWRRSSPSGPSPTPPNRTATGMRSPAARPTTSAPSSRRTRRTWGRGSTTSK